MINKQILVLVAIVVLLGALVGCRQPADGTRTIQRDVLEVRLVPQGEVEANQEVIDEIMPVLEVLFWGTMEDRLSRVQYLSTACTTADGLGGPPKCPSGQAEGTLVEVFPVGGAEGHFVGPDEMDRVLQFSVEGLYAVYQPLPGRDPIEYWPVGDYALLFERKMLNASLPVTVFVQDGKLVRLGFSMPDVDPAQLLSEISLDRILIPPEEARSLTEQIKRPR